MNAGDVPQLFAGMLTQRPWEEVTGRAAAGAAPARLHIPRGAKNQARIAAFVQVRGGGGFGGQALWVLGFVLECVRG
jgi:hypothetical protein